MSDIKYGPSISYEDIEEIKILSKHYATVLSDLNYARSFKLNDILVCECYQLDIDSRTVIKKWLHKNNYGAVRKYKITHIDELGFAYVQELLLDNKYGTIFNINDTVPNDDIYSNRDVDDFKLIIDPEYIDSILLGETNYDPLHELKQLRSLKKEIGDYNDSIRIDTKDLKEFAAFLLSLMPGHIFYRSNKSCFQLKSISIPKVDKRTNRPSLSSIKITMSSKNGARLETFSLKELAKYQLYSSPTRSFSKETKNPKQ